MKHLTFAALALAVGCAPGPVLAQRVAQPPSYRGDLEGFDRDATALPRVIEAAQRNGGRVLEARYDGRHGPSWTLAVERGPRVEFIQMSRPEAGAVAISSSTEPTWMLGWRGRKDADVVRHAKIGLAQAVRRAEADDNGAPAVAAGIAVSASNARTTIPAYNVLLLEPGDHIKRVAVDARTGLPIADPQALANWPA